MQQRYLSREELDRHIAEYRYIGRMLDKHKRYCSVCKEPKGLCIDAHRMDLLLTGLEEWTTMKPSPREYVKVKGRG